MDNDREYESGSWGYSWNSNIYYNPDNCGFRIYAEYDGPHEDYAFNIHIILQDLITGEYYYAEDSGCSCPVPFEDFHGFEDLTRVSEHWAKNWRGE